MLRPSLFSLVANGLFHFDLSVIVPEYQVVINSLYVTTAAHLSLERSSIESAQFAACFFVLNDSSAWGEFVFGEVVAMCSRISRGRRSSGLSEESIFQMLFGWEGVERRDEGKEWGCRACGTRLCGCATTEFVLQGSNGRRGHAHGETGRLGRLSLKTRRDATGPREAGGSRTACQLRGAVCTKQQSRAALPLDKKKRISFLREWDTSNGRTDGGASLCSLFPSFRLLPLHSTSHSSFSIYNVIGTVRGRPGARLSHHENERSPRRM